MPPATVLEPALTQALNRFKTGAGVTPDEIAIFEHTTIDDIWKMVEDLQQEQSSRHCMQAWGRIEPFLTGLTRYSAVIEVFVQGKAEIMAFIWVIISYSPVAATKADGRNRGQ